VRIDRTPPSQPASSSGRTDNRNRAAEAADLQPGASSAASPVREERPELQRRLAQLLAGIDSSDLAALRGVRQSILREVLLWEFGTDRVNTKQMNELLQTIENAMDADPAGERLLSNLAKQITRR
jgi:hypothetical protein